jgi:hypothetical protein
MMDDIRKAADGENTERISQAIFTSSGSEDHFAKSA